MKHITYQAFSCLLFSAFITLLCVPTTANAQLRPHRTLLDNNGNSLSITNYDADIVLHGPLVTTTETITFVTNKSSRGQGHFYFTTPDGGLITAMSLNKGQGFLDAALVEEHHHKVVLPSLSPASLITKAALPSNTLVAEVESLEPEASLAIRIEHIAWLPIVANRVYYTLPLAFTEPLDSFSLRAKSTRSDQPIYSSEPYHFNRFSKTSEPSQTFTFEQSNFRPNSELNLTLNVPKGPVVFVETDPTGTSHALITGIPLESRTDQPIPTRLSIIWDASGSLDKTSKTTALNELGKSLTSLFTGPQSPVEMDVQLRTLRHTLSPPKHFNLTATSVPLLIQHISETPMDGGTRLQAIEELASDTSVDLHLLVTDGLNTIGEVNLPHFKKPLFIAGTKRHSNMRLLQSIANRNNGGVFSFAQPNERTNFKHQIFPAYKNRISISDELENPFQFFPMLYTDVTPSGSFDVIIPDVTNHEKFFVSYPEGLEKNNLEIQVTKKTNEATTLAKIIDFHQALLSAKSQESTNPLPAAPAYLQSGLTFKFLTKPSDLFAYDITTKNTNTTLPAGYESYLPKAHKRQERLRKSKRLALTDAWDRQIAWWENEPSTISPQALSPQLEPVYRWQSGRSLNKTQGQMTLGTQVIQAWDDSTPYLRALEVASPDRLEATYYELREHYALSPAFFLDTSAFFLSRKNTTLAEQILSNVQELALEHMQLNRILAHRYLDISKTERAHELFKIIYHRSPENPQAWREYALSLVERQDYKLGVNILRKLVQRNWPNSPDTELAALVDLNHIVNKSKKLGVKGLKTDPAYARKLDFDFLMTVSWDANSPMDFWTTEPTGIQAKHMVPSPNGGVMHNVTNGGLATYSIREAARGEYTLQTNPVKKASPLWGLPFIVVESYTNYGRNDEQRRTQIISLPLEERNVTTVNF